jgi:hypothetical protein
MAVWVLRVGGPESFRFNSCDFRKQFFPALHEISIPCKTDTDVIGFLLAKSKLS